MNLGANLIVVILFCVIAIVIATSYNQEVDRIERGLNAHDFELEDDED